MYAPSGIHHKLSFLRRYCGCGCQNPLIGRRKCSFVLFFGLVDILGKSPRVSAGASLLSVSLCLRPVLKFHSVGTSLMRNFDLYFSKRRTFFFSDVCLTQGSSRESYSSNWFQYFCAVPWNRCRIWRLSVLWYTNQLSYTFHNSNCTLSSHLFGFLFGCSSTFQCGNEHSAPNLHPDPVLQNWHPGGSQYSQGNLVQVPFKKCLHGCRLDFPDWLLPLTFLCLDALLPLGVGGSVGGAVFGVGFARSLLSCQKLHWSPLEHCPFAFHW